MDTEGYESEVLRSLDSLLAECKPFLKVEVYRKLDDAQRRELFRLIAAHGYAIHKIADNGYEVGETLAEQDLSKWRHFDIFCVPAPNVCCVKQDAGPPFQGGRIAGRSITQGVALG